MNAIEAKKVTKEGLKRLEADVMNKYEDILQKVMTEIRNKAYNGFDSCNFNFESFYKDEVPHIIVLLLMDKIFDDLRNLGYQVERCDVPVSISIGWED